MYTGRFSFDKKRGIRSVKRKKRIIKPKAKIFLFLLLFLISLVGYRIILHQTESELVTQKVGSDLENNHSTVVNSIQKQLEQFALKDKRITKIIQNIEEYPSEILEMLVRNIDMTDYVLDFLNKKGQVYADTIGKVTKGEYPLLLQYDKRWGYGIYGDNVIAVNGCGPTVLSMVIVGLTGRNDITPYKIANDAKKRGYYKEGSGTSWRFMTNGVKEYGIRGIEISLNQSIMVRELKKGHPIVCSMRKGDFTTTGHFILLVGIQVGKFIVHDPNSKERSQRLWSYETLQGQIRNLWSFQIDG